MMACCHVIYMQLQLLEAILEIMDTRLAELQAEYDLRNLPSNEGGSQVLTESLMWLTLLSRYDGLDIIAGVLACTSSLLES
jgi:hypothetical protein